MYTTLLNLPIDVGRIIASLLPQQCVLMMQVACKRTKLFSDSRMKEIVVSLPTKAEVIRYLQSCSESNHPTTVTWYIPPAIRNVSAGIVGSSVLIQVCIEVTDNNSASSCTKYYMDRNEQLTVSGDYSTELVANLSQTLTSIVPNDARVDPNTVHNILILRRSSLLRPFEVRQQLEDSIILPRITPFIGDDIKTVKMLLTDGLYLEDQLLEIENEDANELYVVRMWVYHNTRIHVWDQQHETSRRKLFGTLCMYNSHTYPFLVRRLPDHAQVTWWLLDVIRNKGAARIGIFMQSGVIVVIEVIKGVVTHSAYCIEDMLLVLSVKVPEECLIHNIMKTRRFPGILDHSCLIKVCQVDRESIARYINTYIGWQVSKLLTQEGNRCFFHVPSTKKWNGLIAVNTVVLQKLTLLAYFWMGLGTNELRNTLMKQSFVPLVRLTTKVVDDLHTEYITYI